MTGASTVSVFVPSYNYAHFVTDAVASVLSQPGVDTRVLVIDDCSSDNTAEVCAELATDPRVEYVRHRVNRGHIATYNEGIEWADGDYTVLLSADDMLTPGALHRATRLLDAHPDAGFAYGGAVTFRSWRPLPPARAEAKGGREHVFPGSAWIESVCRAGRNFISSPEVVVRTTAQKQAGGYDPGLPRTGDLEMWLRLASRWDVGWLEDSDQAYYRLHDENMHNTKLATSRETYLQRRAALAKFFTEQGDHVADSARLETLSRTSMARRMLASACRALDAGRQDVDGTPVPELVELAQEIADVSSTRELRALRWRLRVGPQVSRYAGRAAYVASLQHPRAWYRVHVASQRPV